MPLFSVGQIVRPKRLWVRRSGVLVDFQARVTAQAWVASYNGIAGANFGGIVWSPSTSTEYDTDGTGEEAYTLKVWDVEAQEVVTVDYSGDQCDLGSVAGTPISASFASPSPNTANGRLTLNLISTRD